MPAPALHFMYSCQASAEHFQQCAEFLPLRNRGLGPLAVTVLPIPLAMRAAATVCGAPRGKMVSGKEATGIPGTSRSRLGKLARTARALFTAALQSPVQVRGPALNAGSGGHANPGSIAARHR